MPITRRRASLLLSGAAAALAAPASLAQAAWPDHPVHLVVTFIAGGANDIIARLLGQRLSERLGQQFIIDNRAGAGGNVGTEYAVRQPPDGYTLLQLSNAAAANASLYPNLGFNLLTDLTPVAGVYDVPFIVVVRPDFPASTMAEFIAYAKAHPGAVKHGSGGVGSVRGGGGQVMTPSLMTVRPRMASSPMLTSMTPSLVLHSSSVRRCRLVA